MELGGLSGVPGLIESPLDAGGALPEWVSDHARGVQAQGNSHTNSLFPASNRRNSRNTVLNLPPSKQEMLKRHFLLLLTQGVSAWEAMKLLGLNHYTLAFWRENDERMLQAMNAWEKGLALQYEERFQDVFFHPERYDKALSRPSWFTFAAMRLKAIDTRYQEKATTVVDARSITVGSIEASNAVGKARTQQEIIEGVKKQLLPPSKKPTR